MSKKENNTIDKDYPEKGEKTQTNNVFDDVYKTICQKAPELLIPVINEAFGTKYKENASITQLRTEQHESYGIRNTDSVFKVEDHFYHIENQSTDDSKMAIRMIEYDFSIGLEQMDHSSDEKILQLPKSCVIYIRKGDSTARHQHIKVVSASGSSFDYSYEVINVQDYSKDEIFQKHLLMFLPYYLLRYEKKMPTRTDSESFKALIRDLDDLLSRLKETSKANYPNLYNDITALIVQIIDYVVKSKDVKERLGEEMKGKLIPLPSDKLKRAEARAEKRGRQEGRQEGKESTIISLVTAGKLTEVEGAEWLGISLEEIKALINKEELDVM